MASDANETSRSTVDPDLSAKDTVTYSSGDLRAGDSQTAQVELTGELGRYKILRRLGAGGMGTVFLAHDSQFDHQVALKVPHFAKTDDRRVIERFYREARAAIKLRHSNLCPVYDVGEIDGQHFLAMAYIEGRPLSAFIHPNHPLSARQIAHIVCKIALALQEVHENGIVHRDLKPGNIMFDEKRKEPIVMDFGLATQMGGSADARLTRAGTLIGSPAYMSPEQVSTDRDAVGPASDIYSLGVILYELLTGRVPFEGPTAVVLGMIAIKDPEPPSRRRTGVNPQLEAICLKAMAKIIQDRYASMREFALALSAFAAALPPSEKDSHPLLPVADALPVMIPALDETTAYEPVPAALSRSDHSGEQRHVSPMRRFGPWIAGSVGGALAAGLIAYAVFKHGAADPGNASPAASAGNIASATDHRESDPRRPPHPPRHQPGELEDFRRADQDGDGLLTPGEYPMHIILRADSNGDQTLSLGEFDAAHKRLGEGLFGPPTEEEERRLPRQGPPPHAPPRGRPAPPLN